MPTGDDSRMILLSWGSKRSTWPMPSSTRIRQAWPVVSCRPMRFGSMCCRCIDASNYECMSASACDSRFNMLCLGPRCQCSVVASARQDQAVLFSVLRLQQAPCYRQSLCESGRLALRYCCTVLPAKTYLVSVFSG